MSAHDLTNNPADTDPELRRHLDALTYGIWHDAGRLEAELLAIAGSGGRSLYHALLRELAPVDLRPEETAEQWRQVVERQKEMTARLGRPVDIRAALLDWLLESEVVQRPKIVEGRKFEELRESVHRDGLTGLHNFRFFEEHVERELSRCSRRMVPLSLAMIDVDYFKQFNDAHGHDVGNQALIAVSRAMTHCVRQNDVCVRYGGEEFSIVLAETTKSEALDAMRRLRQVVEEELDKISGIDLPSLLTVSIGVATFPGDAIDAPALVRAADKALYESKSGGRNQVRGFNDNTRSYRRADIGLDGKLRFDSGEECPFRTTSVGDGGFSASLDGAREPGSVLEASLEVPGHETPVRVTGRVGYAFARTGGSVETGVRIIDIDSDGRDALTSLLEGHAPSLL